MSINIVPDTNKLLQKYASGKLTLKEFRELKKTVNRESDENLKPVITKEWEKWKDCKPLSASEKERLFVKIRQETKISFVLNWRKQGLQIAASVIIILLTSISILLYSNNREMSELGKRNVVVKVGKGERVSVTLPDGTSVRLNSESTLSYQQDFGLNDRYVFLTGEGFFDVVKNEGKKFIVNTHFLDIQVLGTAFNVYTYEKADSVEMTLVKGNVLVTALTPPYQTFHVNPNEKVVYNKKTGNMRIEASPSQIETAWISNELIFNSIALKDVLKRLERKYSVTFRVDNETPLNDLYTGVFDEADIYDVMNILKENFKFNYYIKKDTIWISYPN